MTGTAFGPQGPNYTTVRPPADPNASAGADTFFKNCSAAGAKDGTFATAAFFNTTLANLRYAVREPGIALDDTDDTMLYQAIKAIADQEIASHQSGGGGSAGIPWALDTSVTSNQITIAFATPFLTIPLGQEINVVLANPVTGATVVNVDSLPSKAVAFADGSPLIQSALGAGKVARLVYDGTKFRVTESQVRGFTCACTGITIAPATFTYASPSVKDTSSSLVTSTYSNGNFVCGAGEGGYWMFGLSAGFQPGGIPLGTQDAFVAYINSPTVSAEQANTQYVGNQGNAAATFLLVRLNPGDAVNFQCFHLQSAGTFNALIYGARLGA